MPALIDWLKKIPLDLGQGERRHSTAGKRIAFSFVPDGKGRKAADLGCGDGHWSEHLKEKGYEVISLDHDTKYSEARVHDLDSGLPFMDNSLDLVWSTEVIEHLHDPQKFLVEVDRVVKPGGLAVLTTPNSSCWFYHLLRIFGQTPQKLQNPDHKHFFSKSSLSAITAGYDIYGYAPPYIAFFPKIRRGAGFWSPTFVLVQRKV